MRVAIALAGTALLLLTGCTSAGTRPEPEANILELTIGHCWVEPVQWEGTTYELPEAQQFGEADHKAQYFTGTGTVTASADSYLRYQDDSGSKLHLRASDGGRPATPDVSTWCR